MSEEKNNMNPEDIEKEKYVDSWLKKIAKFMLGVARRNHYGVVLPELLLSCLMSHDDLKSYYEHAFERASGSINLTAFIKQLDSYVIKNSMSDKRTRRCSLSPQYNEMQEILKRYLIVFHPALAPSLLPLAIMKMESSIGGDMLRAAGLEEKLFFNDAFHMTRRCNDFEEDREEPQAAPEEQDKITRSLEEAMQNLREELKKLHEDIPEDDYDDAEMDASPRFRLRHRKREKESMLKQFAVELVDAAANGKLEPLVGRERELESLITILNQKHANNAIVLGNEGIGKTALVEGLARRIADGNVPNSLQGFRIYSLNLGAMLAGCELRGAFEQRLNGVIDEAINAGNNILFLDEIHTIIGAGAGKDGTLDASNILKPYLSRGELRVIGATTYDEYQKRFLVDRAFARRFSKVELHEPSTDETLQIIRGLAPAYAAFHKVRFDDGILEQIVTLANRYITGRYFPDKAITVMDKCGALYRSGVLRGRKVKPQDVERIICQVANLPAINAGNQNDREQLAGLEQSLKQEIYGQDEAISTLVKHIKVAKAGFHDPRKPLVSAFLCGSSGCGKTELARKIAEKLGISFIKFDMSEYSEEYAASRLIGSAPGYVGYDNPGALTEPVIQTPHCLLLLDEIEKAHRNVFNILLQVLDDGRLTDNKGRVASFKNAIILMTSNAGSQAAAEVIDRLGFNRLESEQAQNRQEAMDRTIRKIFPPEFRNRLQCSLMMNDLDHQALCAVVRKSIRNASLLLTEPAVELEISDDAVDYLARQAAAEKMGARPVERLVETQVKQKLVDEILFGALSKGGSVKIGMAPDGTGLSLECCKAARQLVTTG